MKLSLEVVPLPVTDVDRALAFYTKQAGFTLDVDYHPTAEFRVGLEFVTIARAD